MTIHPINVWNHVRGILSVRPSDAGRWILGSLLLCCAALAGIALPSQAQAQSPLQFTSTDRSMIRAQLDLAITFALQVQEILTTAPDEHGLDRAVALNFESYKLLRFAHQGMLNAKGDTSKRYVNPLLHVASENVQQARYKNLKARAAMKDSIEWAKQRNAGIPIAIGEIQEMIRLTREAVELI